MKILTTRVFKQNNGTYNVYIGTDLIARNATEMTSDEVAWQKQNNECFGEYYSEYIDRDGEIKMSYKYTTSKGKLFNLYLDFEVDEIYICFRGDLWEK